MNQIEQLISSLRDATGDYTALLREKLETISVLMEEGEEHIAVGDHVVKIEDIGLEDLRNFKIASEYESQEGSRNDLYVNVAGGLSFAELAYGEISSVRAPSIVSPTKDTILDSYMVELRGSSYFNYYDIDRDVRQFQITTLDDVSFDNTHYDNSVSLDAITTSLPLTVSPGTDLLWRCRDIDVKGNVSGWSPSVKVTLSDTATPPFISPTITGLELTLGLTPTFYISPYIGDSNEDVIEHTEVEILADDGSRVLLTTIDAPILSYTVPHSTLESDSTYRIRVRRLSSTQGYTDWSVDFVFTTPTISELEVKPMTSDLSPVIQVSEFDSSTYGNGTLMDLSIYKDGTEVWGVTDVSYEVEYAVNTRLESDTTYEIRGRIKGATLGWTEWSSFTFTTGDATPYTPVVSLSESLPLTLTMSPYRIDYTDDAHVSTIVSVYVDGSLIWDKDISLEGILVGDYILPNEALRNGKTHTIYVRYGSENLGYSNRSDPVEYYMQTGNIITPWLSVDDGAVNWTVPAPALSVTASPTNLHLNSELSVSSVKTIEGRGNHIGTQFEILNQASMVRVWFKETKEGNNLSLVVVDDNVLTLSTSYVVRARTLNSVYGWSEWVEVNAATSDVTKVIVPVVTINN